MNKAVGYCYSCMKTVLIYKTKLEMVCKSKTNIMTNRQTRKCLELVFHETSLICHTCKVLFNDV